MNSCLKAKITQIQMPGVQPFKCLGDPNTAAQNWTKWKKSFEYFLGAFGIRNDAKRKAMLLHMKGSETQEVFETLVYQKIRLMKRYSKHKMNTFQSRKMFPLKDQCFIKLDRNQVNQ